MQIKANVKDAVIVSAVEDMRKAIKSKGTKKQKEIAVNTMFWQLMRVLDEMEGGAE